MNHHHLNPPPPPDPCQFRSSFATIGSGGSIRSAAAAAAAAAAADEPEQEDCSLSLQTCCSSALPTTSTPRVERRPLSQSMSPEARHQGSSPADVSPYSRHPKYYPSAQDVQQASLVLPEVGNPFQQHQAEADSQRRERENEQRRLEELPYSNRARLPPHAQQRESEWMEDYSQRTITRQPQQQPQQPHRQRLTGDDEIHPSQQRRVYEYHEQQQQSRRQQYQDFLVAELNRMSLVEQQHQQQDGFGGVTANSGYSPFARNIIRTTRDESAVPQQQQPQHYYSDAVDEHAEYDYYYSATAARNNYPSPRYFPDSSHHHQRPMYQQEPTRQQQQQLQPMPPPPQAAPLPHSPHTISTTTSTRTIEIEVSPGVFWPLRGAAETCRALHLQKTAVTTCLACRHKLRCVDDCACVLCPDCRVLSPVADGANAVGEERTGVGLGLKVEST